MDSSKTKKKKPSFNEIAKADHGLLMAQAYSAMLLENPDTILNRRGRDLRIYNEILRDDQVKSTFQQRRLAVISKEWEVIPASEAPADVEAADFIREQLQSISFDSITDKMLYGVFFGYGVGECLWEQDRGRIILKDIKVRDRSRFHFDIEHNLRLVTRNNPRGELMPPCKFWVFSNGADHSDNPYGLGLAHYLYWPAFFKRNGIKFWLVFLEKFGSPTAIAKLPTGQADDPKERAKALAALSAIQQDSGLVVPDNVLIELLEASRSGTADYDALCDRMDSAISKIVLSQTMTTDDGSSLSQATVHKEVMEQVVKADADMLCESLNKQVVSWLTEWNFPNATPPRVWRNTDPEEDLMNRAERDNKISLLGYEPTEEYITQTYGEGWKKKEAAPLPPTGQGAPPLPKEFSDVSDLTLKRAALRADQQSLTDAAEYLSTHYKTMVGHRVDQLNTAIQESDSLEALQQTITDLQEQPPKEDAITTIKNATLVAKLMGLLRGQRPEDQGQ